MLTKGQLLAFLGLLNGMIGGTILVLPLLGVQTGYLLIPLVALTIGCISFYTCYLIVIHLGTNQNIRQVILQHFNNKHIALVIYNIIIGFSLLGVLVNYFQLIIKQVQGFIMPNQWIPVGVFLVLLGLTVLMRYLSLGERLLAFGILSIVGYLVFLTWAQATAPQGSKSLPPTGQKYIDLGASLMMAFSIHDFVVQVLFKTTDHTKFVKVVKMVFVAGTIIYIFITYGAYSILNRKPRVQQPQTIGEYFSYGSWQTKVIQALYLFHLLSASPEFCLIMRQRFLQMLKIQQSKHITIPQFAIYFLTYLFGYLVYRLHVKISTLIQINGAIIGFVYVCLIPILIHVKCVYFTIHNENGEMVCEQKTENGEILVIEGKCKCKFQYKNKWTRGFEIFVQMGILALGIYTSYYTLRMMFFETEPSGEEL